MEDPDNAEEERRIAEVMQIAESLAVGERQMSDVHDGYTRLGAATHGMFRFKWVAREQENGLFVIDETVGSGTVAVKSVPLQKSDVLAYIDERQRLHFQKVEDVRREWSVSPKITPARPVEAGASAAVIASMPETTPRDPLEMYDEIRRMLKEQK